MPPVPATISLRCRAEPSAIRTLVTDLRLALVQQGLSEDHLGTIEIVVAEALNNIAEHAYAGGSLGNATLCATLSDDGLCVSLRDQGHAIPGGRPPAGVRPDTDVARDALPEGGYGWFLIRELTQTLSYRRVAGENQLDLQFALSEIAPEG